MERSGCDLVSAANGETETIPQMKLAEHDTRRQIEGLVAAMRSIVTGFFDALANLDPATKTIRR
jgi:hypothetical protein